MNQLFGQSADPARAREPDSGTSSVSARPLPVSHAEQALFHLDIKRSLQLHGRLAGYIAIAGLMLGVMYFLSQALVFKTWPSYEANSVVYIQPIPSKVLEPSQGGPPRGPFDSYTYETYIQRQMMNVTRNDVLASAIQRLKGWRLPDESDQAAAQRLAQSLSVMRQGSAYQFSIGARAETPQMAAQVANAVTAAYVQSLARDQRTEDSQPLSEQRDRNQNALTADHGQQESLNQQAGVAPIRAGAPGPLDEDSSGTRQELNKTRNGRDGAEAKFAVSYQVTQAVAPLGRTKSGVLRNSVLLLWAGLFSGVLAAVTAHKLDPRVYIAKDVEWVLGFPPTAQLPDFSEVSDGVAEEHLLRLASSIEHACKQSNLRSCVFTGTSTGTGVTMLVNRVMKMLDAMGRPTVLVDATGIPAPRDSSTANGNIGPQGLAYAERVRRPSALLQQMIEETETQDQSLVLTDTAPLAVSAETDYLVRFADCAIVVIESGRTTRRELLETAATLERLDVGAVGFVLNRVGLAKANPAFRLSMKAIEKHLQTQAHNDVRRAKRSKFFASEETANGEALQNGAAARALFEPGLAAAAAAVARFSMPAVSGPEACLPSPMASMPVAESTKRISFPLNPGPSVSHSSHAVSRPADSDWLSAVPREQPAQASAAAVPVGEPRSSQKPEPATHDANSNSEVPWWLSITSRKPEPTHPPVLWQPAKVRMSPKPEFAPEPWLVLPHVNLETAETAAATVSGERPLDEYNTPRADAVPYSLQEFGVGEARASNASRLGGLRNLAFVLGAKAAHRAEEQKERQTVAGSNLASKNEQPTAERMIPLDAANDTAINIGGASSRLVTAPPHLLPPSAIAVNVDQADAQVSESSTRQDRRAANDEIEILPSRRGQYEKI
jgi:hypothetical protein